jgi:hypothetical protein
VKTITQSERPVGRYSKYEKFYTETILKETQKAFLIKLEVDFWGMIQRWVPKSQCLVYPIDQKRNEYFIHTFFLKISDPPEIYNVSQSSQKEWSPQSEEECLRIDELNYL